MNQMTVLNNEQRVKELIAERMASSVRFLFECFLDTGQVEVSVNRDGSAVISTVAGQKYSIEAVEDIKALIAKYATLTNLQQKEYGDRRAMKLVYTVLVKLYAGGHISDAAFRQQEMLSVVKKRVSNYKVV